MENVSKNDEYRKEERDRVSRNAVRGIKTCDGNIGRSERHISTLARAVRANPLGGGPMGDFVYLNNPHRGRTQFFVTSFYSFQQMK